MGNSKHQSTKTGRGYNKNNAGNNSHKKKTNHKHRHSPSTNHKHQERQRRDSDSINLSNKSKKKEEYGGNEQALANEKDTVISSSSSSNRIKDDPHGNAISIIEKKEDAITFLYPEKEGNKEFSFEAMFYNNNCNNDDKSKLSREIKKIGEAKASISESIDDILQLNGNIRKIEVNKLPSSTKQTTQSSNITTKNSNTTTKTTENTITTTTTPITPNKSSAANAGHTIEVNLTNLQKTRKLNQEIKNTDKTEPHFKTNNHLLGNNLIIPTWDDDDEDEADNINQKQEKLSRETITKSILKKDRKKRKGMHLDKWDATLDTGKTKKVKEKKSKTDVLLEDKKNKRNQFQQLQSCLQSKKRKGKVEKV